MIIKFKNKKGVALIIIFLVVTVLLIFSGTFVSVSVNQKNTAEIFKIRTQAFNLAEAGLDHALVWLRNQSVPPIGDKTNPWGGIQNVGGGSYSVTITDLGLISGIGHRYKITSTGSLRNTNRILTNYVQPDNFARYLWFTNKESYKGTTVWFSTMDHLNGPTRTNQRVNIMGNPVFEGKVSSSNTYIRYYNNGSNINSSLLTNPPYDIPDFQQGVDFGVMQASLPTQANSLKTVASSGGLLLQGNTTVTLNSDSTMNVTNSSNSWVNQNMPLPANGVLFINAGQLTISGTLSGRLTAGASKEIIVPNNLIYADDPRINPGSTDVLSLISNKDVVISASAPVDLEIDGSFMGLNTSLVVESYWVGPPKGTLTVYGGIVQKERGPVGTFNGSTGVKVSGYSKNYSYDPRLLSNPPPFMLTTGDYITLATEEK